MTHYDPDAIGAGVDYDLADFETRDAIDAERLRSFYAGAGFADRPGTRRALGTDWTHDPAVPRVIVDLDLAGEFDLDPALLEEAS